MILNDKINKLKNCTIFKNLSEKDLSQIAEVSCELNFNKGDIIFEENSMADAFFIISKGEVDIIKRGDADGTQEVLATKTEGDVFGEMAIIDDLPRSATIKAKTDIELLKISKEDFNELLKSFSHISLDISRSICSTVRVMNSNYISDLERRNRQLKAAYSKLKKAQNDLIRAEKLSVVGKFASFILHDIKNPMSNIKAYSELIMMNTPSDLKIVTKSSNIIINEVDRLCNMTNELLEFSRGELNINKTPINLPALISTLIDNVKDELSNKGISIVLSEKFDCVIMADSEKIKRVFHNLISNACDAFMSGGKIIIKIIDEGNFVKLSFQDNGIGMEHDVLKRIFEPFYSFNKKEGTGLGMTIIKNIIENHGGTIRPISIKGAGTRFDIFLPKA